MDLDKQINLKKALLMLIGITVLLVVGGYTIGYSFFWDKASISQTERDIQEFTRELGDKPKSTAALVDLGWSYYQQGRKDKALEYYQKALKVDSKNIAALYNMGLVLGDMGKLTEAEQQFKKVISYNKNHELAYFSLGTVNLRMKKYNQAIGYFKNALRINPNSATTHYELGSIYEKQGNKVVAHKEYLLALKFVPDYKEAKLALERVGER